MSNRADVTTPPVLDEGSWIYLSLSAGEVEDELRDSLTRVCEESGWPSVSELPAGPGSEPLEVERYFEGMSHAVAHADAVVVFGGDHSDLANREIDLARQYGRPVVRLYVANESADSSGERAELLDYDRGRLVACAGTEQVAAGLRAVLTDPSFAALVCEAAADTPEHD